MPITEGFYFFGSKLCWMLQVSSEISDFTARKGWWRFHCNLPCFFVVVCFAKELLWDWIREISSHAANCKSERHSIENLWLWGYPRLINPYVRFNWSSFALPKRLPLHAASPALLEEKVVALASCGEPLVSCQVMQPSVQPLFGGRSIFKC